MSVVEITSLQEEDERFEVWSEIAKTGVEVNIPISTRRELGIHPTKLAQSILLNAWLLPSRTRGNRILAQASYARNVVSSATIPVTDLSGQQTECEIDIVSKPTGDLDLALKELQNLERLHLETDIRGVLPFAVLDIKSNGERFAFVLSRLKKGVIPIERLKIEEFLPTQRIEFLEELAEFTAQLANQGVIHGDLRPKNIWYDITQSDPNFRTNFGLFDLELSEIIIRPLLLKLRDVGRSRPTVEQLMECARIANRFLEDAADLAGALMDSLPAVVVRENFAIPYLERRWPIICEPSSEESLNYIMREALINGNTDRSA